MSRPASHGSSPWRSGQDEEESRKIQKKVEELKIKLAQLEKK